MMTFTEFLASQGRAGKLPAFQLHPKTAVGFATPGTEDTKRAVEQARRRGTTVTPADLTKAISPKSKQIATQGVLDLSAAPPPRITGSTSRTARTLG